MLSPASPPWTQPWSRVDREHLSVVRAHVARFASGALARYCMKGDKATGNPLARWQRQLPRVLEIGPEHDIFDQLDGAAEHETLSIDPQSPTTYTADITLRTGIAAGRFDCVVFTEVMGHTLDPTGALREIRRLLAPGGVLLMTYPFNLRMHAPHPDRWRHTEHGVTTILVDTLGFELITFRALDTP